MKKGILVIGGTGATGKHVLHAVAALLPDIPVSGTSRNPSSRAGKADLVRWDATAPEAEARLRGYDLVISCLGPSSRFRDLVQKACLRAGVDCIDINDDFQTASDIWKLRGAAAQKDVRLYACMGMNPGLSTLLLFMLRQAMLGENPSASLQKASVCVLSGADEDAGLAATHTMLDCLAVQSASLRGKRAAYVRADDSDASAFVRFPGHGERVFTAQCSSAEPALLENTSEYLASWPGLAETPGEAVPPASDVDYRMHFQGMPKAMAGWLRSNTVFKTPERRQWLARLFLKMHHASRKKAGNMDRSILSVFGRHEGRRCAIAATGSTVFGMTAAFAAAVARVHLQHRQDIPPGVHFAHPCWLAPSEILPLLRRLGVEVHYAAC